MTVAVFPGTFDPVTNGHLDLIERSARLFDKLIVAIFDNPVKKQLFDVNERRRLLEQVTQDLGNVEIDSFHDTLLVFYARQHQADVIVRGVRALADFEYESQMTLMNRYLTEEIDTVYLTPRAEYSYVASSLIKEVAAYGGNVGQLVPAPVFQALQDKLQQKS
jgi:pantetheine-phosphate adenylyltransferase